MGKTVSYFVDDETVAAIQEHARRNWASQSWALRDLVRRGIAVVQIREDLKLTRENQKYQREG